MQADRGRDAVAGLQPETMEVQAPTRGRLIPAVAAILYVLIHPRTREGGEASAESGGSSKPRTLHASRSTMDAGITGGFSPLMHNSPRARNSR